MANEGPEPALVVERVRLDSLRIDERNPRHHSQTNLRSIEASLRTFGQQKPIVVDEANRVIAGNGTLMAARSLGWNEIAVVRSTLKGRRARAFAIADNRTAELADWDLPVLGELLRAVRDGAAFDGDPTGMVDEAGDAADTEEPDLACATGFSDREIDRILEGTVNTTEAAVDPIDEEWLIIITCESEAQQRSLLERLTREGLSCRAVM